MANRRLYQFHEKYEAKTVEILMKVTIAGSGAPTLVANQNKGIVSIARASAGKYTITLKDKFMRLLSAQSTSINATGISAAPQFALISDNSASTTPTVVVQYANNAVTATDPASGDVLLISLKFKNSSI